MEKLTRSIICSCLAAALTTSLAQTSHAQPVTRAEQQSREAGGKKAPPVRIPTDKQKLEQFCSEPENQANEVCKKEK